MNKVKAALAKIKLKDYEKQWLLSWILWGISTLVISSIVGIVHEIVLGLLGLVWIIWGLLNAVGTLYSICRAVAEWIDDLSGDSWISKTVNWFKTDDRY